MTAKKRISKGAKVGGGLPPGYFWNIEYFTSEADTARKKLHDQCYLHIVMQINELAREEDPSHCDTIRVEKIKSQDFYEMKLKGGVLGKINYRVFYAIDKENKTIVVLGGFKKKNDGSTPSHIITSMRINLRDYNEIKKLS